MTYDTKTFSAATFSNVNS